MVCRKERLFAREEELTVPDAFSSPRLNVLLSKPSRVLPSLLGMRFIVDTLPSSHSGQDLDWFPRLSGANHFLVQSLLFFALLALLSSLFLLLLAVAVPQNRVVLHALHFLLDAVLLLQLLKELFVKVLVFDQFMSEPDERAVS